ncbi:hypothetical protein ASPNIDRAFT_54981 [Aspergillus niger ATCC 1015]|uniref:Uncharacterized protein n=1 Tax=Aspergillus niger (strain ATCC 1015 / CBS 113.46 / FGSC A1144 / LSHB Ac4 / NCTC 3858a / NRRL 328 / USDA 3528.7) TaxID=380704 RepID=G3Y9M2_ASPNA|nr:hypothetical protein ASPNIDRAFT_54981 [Aspergillus niger ATCC 1015]
MAGDGLEVVDEDEVMVEAVLEEAFDVVEGSGEKEYDGCDDPADSQRWEMRVSGSLKQRQAPERTDNIKRMEALGWKHVGSREFQGSKAQREKMSASQKRRDERAAWKGNMILALRNRNGGGYSGGPVFGNGEGLRQWAALR